MVEERMQAIDVTLAQKLTEQAPIVRLLHSSHSVWKVLEYRRFIVLTTAHQSEL